MLAALDSGQDRIRGDGRPRGIKGSGVHEQLLKSDGF
jgi:hypothetical protein